MRKADKRVVTMVHIDLALTERETALVKTSEKTTPSR